MKLVNARECAIHEKIEPFEGENPYQCFECGHVYPDDKAILRKFRKVFPGGPTPIDANDVAVCPLCLHDW